MKFEVNEMYKHLMVDKDTAFIVDEIVSQKSNKEIELVVTWYKKTDSGRYVSIGMNGEFNIPYDSRYHYIRVE